MRVLKRFAIALCVGSCFFAFGKVQVSASTGPVNVIAANTEDEKESLRAMVESKGKLFGEVYKDFDGDGDLEMVAEVQSKFVTGPIERETGDADYIFYVDDDVADLTDMIPDRSEWTCFFEDGLTAAKVKNGYIVMCRANEAVVNSRTYEWFIKNDGAIKYLPSLPVELSYHGKNQFTGICDAYDISFIKGFEGGSGHSYKPYYFYWDGKRFCEYGGKKISVSKLKSYKGGAKKVKEILAANPGNKISSIYYRKNGLININLKLTSVDEYRYCNVTLKLKNNKLSYYEISSWGKSALQKASNEGYYLKAAKIKGVKVVYP